MKVYLFDERVTDQWHPFALTRPCGELRFGDRLLRERTEAFTGCRVTAALSRSWLTAFDEPGAPPVLDRDMDHREGDPDTRAGDRLFLSSRFVPSVGSRWSRPDAEDVLLLLADGQPVGAWVPDGLKAPEASWFREPGELSGSGEIELAGSRLSRVWDLIERNPDQLAADLAIGPPTPPPRGSHGVGEGPVFLAKSVTVEPGVLFDTRHGGIRLEPGVEVRAGARLAGPLHAGPGSRLLGGSYECLAAGPLCYLRGEIEESIVIGHSN
ncbi:MAG: putative sugar nucleotidyl transferase, partial [Gemmatimonadota bacterium]